MPFPPNMTTPPSVELKETPGDQESYGAFCIQMIKSGTRFGPYMGEIIQASEKQRIETVNLKFAWHVNNTRTGRLQHVVDASDPCKGNWLRYINCAANSVDQNLQATQEGSEIFYRATKDIFPGEELLTYFDPMQGKMTTKKKKSRAGSYTYELVPVKQPDQLMGKRQRKKKGVGDDMLSLDDHDVIFASSGLHHNRIRNGTNGGNVGRLNSTSLPAPRFMEQKFRPQSTGVAATAAPARVLSSTMMAPVASPAMTASNAAASITPQAAASATGPKTFPSYATTSKAPIPIATGPKNLVSSCMQTDSVPLSVLPFPMVQNSAPSPTPSGSSATHSEPDTRQSQISKHPLLQGRKSINQIAEKLRKQKVVPNNGDSRDSSSTGTAFDGSSKNGWGFIKKESNDNVGRPSSVSSSGRRSTTSSLVGTAEDVEEHLATDLQFLFRITDQQKQARSGGSDDSSTPFVYSCEICKNKYHKAANLKRHFLREHINHKYLSPDDLAFLDDVDPSRLEADLDPDADFPEDGSEITTSVEDKENSLASLPLDGKIPFSFDGIAGAEDAFRCNLCVRLFPSLHKLRYHLDHDAHRSKSDKPFGCDRCGQRFRFYHKFLRHMESHGISADKMTTACNICGKKFLNKANMKKHLRFHSGKNFPCKYGCEGVIYPNVAELVKHLKLFHPDRKLGLLVQEDGEQQTPPVVPVEGETPRKRGRPPKHTMLPKSPSITAPMKQMKKEYRTEEEARQEFNSLHPEGWTDPRGRKPREDVQGVMCTVCSKKFSSYASMCRHRRTIHRVSGKHSGWTHSSGGADYNSSSFMEMDPAVAAAYAQEEAEEDEEIEMDVAGLRKFHIEASVEMMYREIELEQEAREETERKDRMRYTRSQEAPALSPRSFYANVSKNIAENLTENLDGGLESLKGVYDNIKVPDYVPLNQAHTIVPPNFHVDWALYNLPRYYDLVDPVIPHPPPPPRPPSPVDLTLEGENAPAYPTRSFVAEREATRRASVGSSEERQTRRGSVGSMDSKSDRLVRRASVGSFDHRNETAAENGNENAQQDLSTSTDHESSIKNDSGSQIPPGKAEEKTESEEVKAEDENSVFNCSGDKSLPSLPDQSSAELVDASSESKQDHGADAVKTDGSNPENTQNCTEGLEKTSQGVENTSVVKNTTELADSVCQNGSPSADLVAPKIEETETDSELNTKSDPQVCNSDVPPTKATNSGDILEKENISQASPQSKSAGSEESEGSKLPQEGETKKENESDSKNKPPEVKQEESSTEVSGGDEVKLPSRNVDGEAAQKGERSSMQKGEGTSAQDVDNDSVSSKDSAADTEDSSSNKSSSEFAGPKIGHGDHHPHGTPSLSNPNRKESKIKKTSFERKLTPEEMQYLSQGTVHYVRASIKPPCPHEEGADQVVGRPPQDETEEQYLSCLGLTLRKVKVKKGEVQAQAGKPDNNASEVKVGEASADNNSSKPMGGGVSAENVSENAQSGKQDLSTSVDNEKSSTKNDSGSEILANDNPTPMVNEESPNDVAQQACSSSDSQQAVLPSDKDKTESSEVPQNDAKAEVPQNDAKAEVPQNDAKAEVPQNDARAEVPQNDAKAEVPQNDAGSPMDTENRDQTDTSEQATKELEVEQTNNSSSSQPGEASKSLDQTKTPEEQNSNPAEATGSEETADPNPEPQSSTPEQGSNLGEAAKSEQPVDPNPELTTKCEKEKSEEAAGLDKTADPNPEPQTSTPEQDSNPAEATGLDKTAGPNPEPQTRTPKQGSDPKEATGSEKTADPNPEPLTKTPEQGSNPEKATELEQTTDPNPEPTAKCEQVAKSGQSEKREQSEMSGQPTISDQGENEEPAKCDKSGQPAKHEQSEKSGQAAKRDNGENGQAAESNPEEDDGDLDGQVLSLKSALALQTLQERVAIDIEAGEESCELCDLETSEMSSPSKRSAKDFQKVRFGRNHRIFVVCSMCRRYFYDVDSVLRHQWARHPSIQCSYFEVDNNLGLEMLLYPEPSPNGVLAQSQLLPPDYANLDSYSCLRCKAIFKQYSRLKSHILNCDPNSSASANSRKKKWKATMAKVEATKQELSKGRKDHTSSSTSGLRVGDLSFRNKGQISSKGKAPAKLGRPRQVASSTTTAGAVSLSSSQTSTSSFASSTASSSGRSSYHVHLKHASATRKLNLDAGEGPSFGGGGRGRRNRKQELLYNPAAHIRLREKKDIVDIHQCQGCGLKFRTLSLLERHTKNCSGKEKFQNQKSSREHLGEHGVKKHSCHYCPKWFKYLKGVSNHYANFCHIRAERLAGPGLSLQDQEHEAQLQKQLEQQAWNRTLNHDHSDVIQGRARLHDDGTITHTRKRGGWPKGLKRANKRKRNGWTNVKKRKLDGSGSETPGSATRSPKPSSSMSSISSSSSSITSAAMSELKAKLLEPVPGRKGKKRKFYLNEQQPGPSSASKSYSFVKAKMQRRSLTDLSKAPIIDRMDTFNPRPKNAHQMSDGDLECPPPLSPIPPPASVSADVQGKRRRRGPATNTDSNRAKKKKTVAALTEPKPVLPNLQPYLLPQMGEGTPTPIYMIEQTPSGQVRLVQLKIPTLVGAQNPAAQVPVSVAELGSELLKKLTNAPSTSTNISAVTAAAPKDIPPNFLFPSTSEEPGQKKEQNESSNSKQTNDDDDESAKGRRSRARSRDGTRSSSTSPNATINELFKSRKSPPRVSAATMKQLDAYRFEKTGAQAPTTAVASTSNATATASTAGMNTSGCKIVSSSSMPLSPTRGGMPVLPSGTMLAYMQNGPVMLQTSSAPKILPTASPLSPNSVRNVFPQLLPSVSVASQLSPASRIIPTNEALQSAIAEGKAFILDPRCLASLLATSSAVPVTLPSANLMKMSSVPGGLATTTTIGAQNSSGVPSTSAKQSKTSTVASNGSRSQLSESSKPKMDVPNFLFDKVEDKSKISPAKVKTSAQAKESAKAKTSPETKQPSSSAAVVSKLEESKKKRSASSSTGGEGSAKRQKPKRGPPPSAVGAPAGRVKSMSLMTSPGNHTLVSLASELDSAGKVGASQVNGESPDPSSLGKEVALSAEEKDKFGGEKLDDIKQNGRNSDTKDNQNDSAVANQNTDSNSDSSPNKGRKSIGKDNKKKEGSPIKGGNNNISTGACVLKVPVVERRLSSRSVSPQSDDDLPLSVVASATRKEK